MTAEVIAVRVQRCDVFSKNVGGPERIARLALGAGLVYAAATRWRDGLRGKLALVAGLDLLVTGSTGWCPSYAVLERYAGRDREVEHLSDVPA